MSDKINQGTFLGIFAHQCSFLWTQYFSHQWLSFVCQKSWLNQQKLKLSLKRRVLDLGIAGSDCRSSFQVAIFHWKKSCKIGKLEIFKTLQLCSRGTVFSWPWFTVCADALHWCRPLQSARSWEPGSKTTKAMKNQQEPELGSLVCSQNPWLALTERDLGSFGRLSLWNSKRQTTINNK